LALYFTNQSSYIFLINLIFISDFAIWLRTSKIPPPPPLQQQLKLNTVEAKDAVKDVACQSEVIRF